MSYTVHIEPSGYSFDVEPHETILDAALRHGHALPPGCRRSGCNNCVGRVLAGTLDYGTEPPLALSAEDRASGKVVLCQAHAGSDLIIEIKEIAALADIPVKTLPVVVQGKQRLANDVMRLYLKLPQRERLEFLAGQYIDILLKDGRRRSFSIANMPREDRLLELHIRHVEGGEFTGYIFEQLREGDVLRIEGPLGSFFLRKDSPRPLVFIAGGTGFAPVKSILELAFAEDMSQPITLYWGTRNEDALYLDRLPRQWARKHANFRYVPVLSEPSAHWQGLQGHVHEAAIGDLRHSGEDIPACDVYACGPPVMVKSAFLAFRELGLDEAHFFSDAFEFQSPKPEGP